MRELRGVGGWLLVFLVLAAVVSTLLVIGLGMLLSHDALTPEQTLFAVLGVGFAVLGNCAGIILLSLERPRGVPLAQRGLVLTLLATIHLALLQHIAMAPFLELVLVCVGFVLAWSIYFGFSAYIHRKHFQVDVSRRIAATYPADARPLPLLVRAVYSLVIVAYAAYIVFVVWHIMTYIVL